MLNSVLEYRVWDSYLDVLDSLLVVLISKRRAVGSRRPVPALIEKSDVLDLIR
jgi:predicted RNase H-like nuclease